jgi:hypothetical protein
MSTTAKSARKKCCLALMSFVVVSAAVLYVWLPQAQALTVTVSQRGWEAADSAARADGREQAGVQRTAEIVYGRVSGPKGSLRRGAAVLSCPGRRAIKRSFGRRGVFRKVLHRHSETCAFVLRADFAGHWYSAHGALKLKPGHAYYIRATLKATGLFAAFPFETY